MNFDKKVDTETKYRATVSLFRVEGKDTETRKKADEKWLADQNLTEKSIRHFREIMKNDEVDNVWRVDMEDKTIGILLSKRTKEGALRFTALTSASEFWIGDPAYRSVWSQYHEKDFSDPPQIRDLIAFFLNLYMRRKW